MTVAFKKVFRFDLDRNAPVEIPVSANKDDFNEYIDLLAQDVVFDARSKKYLFPAEQTTITAGINSIIVQNKAATASDLARRLMRIEVNVQNQIEHLNREVQKGILILTTVHHNDQNLFLLIKAEHTDFINEKDNKRATGLPIKKKIFKAFCAYLDQNNSPTHAMVKV